MKPVTLTPAQWKALRAELQKDHPVSVFALRSKMRSVLGFTIREHKEYYVNSQFKEQAQRGEDTAHGWYKDVVHLDFYSDSKRTFFLMKHSEFLNSIERTL